VGIVIGSGEFPSFCALFRSGLHYVDRASISVSDFDGGLRSGGSFSVEYMISDAIGSVSVDAYLVVEDDISGILRVAGSLWVGVHDGLVELRPYWVSWDLHVLSFSGVNDICFISDGFDVKADVISGASETRILSVTRAAAQRVVPYQSHSPSPLPIVIFAYSGSSYCYIYWLNPSQVQTSWGYSATIQPKGQEQTVKIGAVSGLGLVRVEMRNISLTAYTILFGVRLRNLNSSSILCDVGIDADEYVNGDCTHSISVISVGHGLYWASSNYVMNVIASSNYPLTTGLSTYWFGLYTSRTANRWNQIDAIECLVGLDYCMCIAWQNLAVSGCGSTSVSFMYRSRLHYPEQPTITITAYPEDVPGLVYFLLVSLFGILFRRMY
jgi:hypothetical protein